MFLAGLLQLTDIRAGNKGPSFSGKNNYPAVAVFLQSAHRVIQLLKVRNAESVQLVRLVESNCGNTLIQFAENMFAHEGILLIHKIEAV